MRTCGSLFGAGVALGLAAGAAMLSLSLGEAAAQNTFAGAFTREKLPAGTLRATYIATNPVQAFIDPKSGEVRGPGADIAREIARRLNVAVKITGVAGPAGVIDSVKKGEADIGFLAFDPLRVAEVDFSQVYAVAQNTYMVRADSALKTVADVDRPGVTVGVTERDAADLFLSRALHAAALRRNATGKVETALQWLGEGTVDAYGTNRQRLTDLAARNPGYRLLPDNFYGVEQSVVAAKGKKPLLDFVNGVLDDARASGLIARSIEAAGLNGVDIAPARE
jgi:polar amino acid transport system substrate-binding protein